MNIIDKNLVDFYNDEMLHIFQWIERGILDVLYNITNIYIYFK